MIHIVAGPTASGKTIKALQIARSLGNAELINADSRQIYKYLDIGTNKEKVEFIGNEVIDGLEFPVFLLENIPIHLLSFLEPDRQFNASEYQKLVFQLIANLQKLKKEIIIVGGTGLYLAAIMNPQKYSFSEGESELRGELTGLSLQELQLKAEATDPIKFAVLNNSDRNNPIRLIRLIEKANNPPPINTNEFPQYEFQVHYPEFTQDQLTPKINQRVIDMWDHGLVEEVENVLSKGFPKDSVSLQGIGYREILDYLDGKVTAEKCIELIQTAHRQYAKRQITWFKKHLLS